jgi:hypothetical protein
MLRARAGRRVDARIANAPKPPHPSADSGRLQRLSLEPATGNAQGVRALLRRPPHSAQRRRPQDGGLASLLADRAMRAPPIRRPRTGTNPVRGLTTVSSIEQAPVSPAPLWRMRRGVTPSEDETSAAPLIMHRARPHVHPHASRRGPGDGEGAASLLLARCATASGRASRNLCPLRPCFGKPDRNCLLAARHPAAAPTLSTLEGPALSAAHCALDVSARRCTVAPALLPATLFPPRALGCHAASSVGSDLRWRNVERSSPPRCDRPHGRRRRGGRASLNR